MRIYISGPMTGYPDLNVAAFTKAEDDLLIAGHEPISPARHPVRAGWAWADYMRVDIADLITCEAVAILPGWECSRGARLEVHVAHSLGMTVLPLNLWRADR